MPARPRRRSRSRFSATPCRRPTAASTSTCTPTPRRHRCCVPVVGRSSSRTRRAAAVSVGADAAVIKGDSGTQTLNFNVTLSSPQAFPVQVDYYTSNGSAIDPDNYQGDSGTLDVRSGADDQDGRDHGQQQHVHPADAVLPVQLADAGEHDHRYDNGVRLHLQRRRVQHQGQRRRTDGRRRWPA